MTDQRVCTYRLTPRGVCCGEAPISLGIRAGVQSWSECFHSAAEIPQRDQIETSNSPSNVAAVLGYTRCLEPQSACFGIAARGMQASDRFYRALEHHDNLCGWNHQMVYHVFRKVHLYLSLVAFVFFSCLLSRLFRYS